MGHGLAKVLSNNNSGKSEVERRNSMIMMSIASRILATHNFKQNKIWYSRTLLKWEILTTAQRSIGFY